MPRAAEAPLLFARTGGLRRAASRAVVSPQREAGLREAGGSGDNKEANLIELGAEEPMGSRHRKGGTSGREIKESGCEGGHFPFRGWRRSWVERHEGLRDGKVRARGGARGQRTRRGQNRGLREEAWDTRGGAFWLGPVRRGPQLRPTWWPLRSRVGRPERGPGRLGNRGSRGVRVSFPQKDNLSGVETRATGAHRPSEPRFLRLRSEYSTKGGSWRAIVFFLVWLWRSRRKLL